MATVARRAGRPVEEVVRKLNAGAVHIEIHPRPKNLAESREIMHVVQGYGELSMFKHLKHEPQGPAPNIALAIFHDAQAAKKMIDASPLRFTLDAQKPQSSTGLPSSGGRTSYKVTMQDPRQYQRAEDEGESPKESKSIYEGENVIGLTERNQFGEEIVSLKSVKPKAKEKEDDNLLDLISKSTGWGDKYDEEPPNSIIVETPSTAVPQSSPSIPFPTFTPNPIPSSEPHSTTSPPITSANDTSTKEFYLSVTPSILDHAAYIARQGYYGSFVPDLNSPMAADLERRVPLVGLADLNVRKPELYLRARHRREEKEARAKEEGRGRKTLREMWEDGMKRAGKEIPYETGSKEG